MSTQPASLPPPNPANIFDTINADQRSAALKAAIELKMGLAHRNEAFASSATIS